MPPYALPANKTQSGIKSRSSPKGGGANFNEIRFEDKKGAEQLYIHAEKNQDIVVENDETHCGRQRPQEDDRQRRDDRRGQQPHRDGRQRRDDHDQREPHGGVSANETITIGGDRIESVAGNETIDIDGNRTETVRATRASSIERQPGPHRGGNQTIAVSGSRDDTVTGSLSQP